MQQLEEKQKQENPAQGQPIVLKDPALSYQPKKVENGSGNITASNSFTKNGNAPTFGSFGALSSSNGSTKTEPDANSEQPKVN